MWRSGAGVVAAAVTLLGCLFITATGVRADSGACHIGKPLYCMKYAGLICPKENTAPNVPEACAAWERACLECHGEIHGCLGEAMPPRDSPLCDKCENEWRSCMHRIDAQHWPNRRAKRE